MMILFIRLRKGEGSRVNGITTREGDTSPGNSGGGGEERELGPNDFEAQKSIKNGDKRSDQVLEEPEMGIGGGGQHDTETKFEKGHEKDDVLTFHKFDSLKKSKTEIQNVSSEN